jgi:hypothetical protein
VYRRTRGSPKLSEADKAVRYQWCKNNVMNNFENYVFVDETTVRVLEVPIYHLRKANSRPETISHTVKQRLKVNIWGGISSKGATPFAVSFQNQLTINFVISDLFLLGI